MAANQLGLDFGNGPILPITPQWYCARSKPGQEQIALDNLQRQQFIAYYPKITIERRKRGRITRDREGLFPGYVLVKLALENCAWRAINSTRGVIRLLSFNEDGRPSPLPTCEIEALQDREKAGQLFISEIVRLRRGDRVRLKVGPAVDQIGTVVKTRGERVELLLQLLGSQVKCLAPLHCLEILDRSRREHLQHLA